MCKNHSLCTSFLFLKIPACLQNSAMYSNAVSVPLVNITNTHWWFFFQPTATHPHYWCANNPTPVEGGRGKPATSPGSQVQVGGPGCGVNFPRGNVMPLPGVWRALTSATGMDSHVKAARHSKNKEGDAKNWICSGKNHSMWNHFFLYMLWFNFSLWFIFSNQFNFFEPVKLF